MDYYISHHGIQGQKWGVRRYQNPDGSLTAAGKKHVSYSKGYVSKDQLKSDIKDGSFESRKTTKLADKVLQAQKDGADTSGLEKELKKSQARDSFAVDRAQLARSRSTGKRVALYLLTGVYGSITYDTMRASGYSKGKSAVTAALTGLGGLPAALIVNGVVESKEVKSRAETGKRQSQEDDVMERN